MPVELRDRVTDVVAARGKPAPQFVFANYQDFGYFLTMLDSASVRSAGIGGLGTVADPFLRTMLWGALWDQVRDAQIEPTRFARLALKELPREKDEQLVASIVGRLTPPSHATRQTSGATRCFPNVEHALWTGAMDASKPYSIRRSYVDAFIAVAHTADGVGKLRGLLNADSVAGEPMRDPTRWEIVTRLMILDVADAQRLLVAQAFRDTTPDGHVARSRRERRRNLPRSNSSTSPATSPTNHSMKIGPAGRWAHSTPRSKLSLTLPYLRPALDSLPYIQSNRRIFFLGSWLGAFIGGQRSEAGFATVRAYLADHPASHST